MSTSIIGFRDKNKKFVVFGADSRSTEPEYGEVVDDDRNKIHKLCQDFVAVGTGSRDTIQTVYITVADKSRHKPPQTVKEVAELVALCATELMILSNSLPPEKIPPGYLISGAKLGRCDLFTVLCRQESVNDMGKGNKKETYGYVAVEAETALLGHGRRLMMEQLVEMGNYPIRASTPFEAKEVMKKAMYHAKQFDFCTDGKFRVLTLCDDGTMSCSTATPLDQSPGSLFDEWVEHEFRPAYS